ncbi:hypothetical protein ACHAPU_007174 [Fusarium lateritium]
MLPLPVSHNRPNHKSIRQSHGSRTKIPKAQKFCIPGETNVEEEEADDDVSAPVDPRNATHKFPCLRIGRDRVFKLAQGGFGAHQEVDSNEGWEKGYDVRRLKEE